MSMDFFVTSCYILAIDIQFERCYNESRTTPMPNSVPRLEPLEEAVLD